MVDNCQTIQEKLEAIKEAIRKLTEKKNAESEGNAAESVENSNAEDWEWVANVTERFCLVFFFLSVVVITSIILTIGWLSEQ